MEEVEDGAVQLDYSEESWDVSTVGTAAYETVSEEEVAAHFMEVSYESISGGDMSGSREGYETANEASYEIAEDEGQDLFEECGKVGSIEEAREDEVYPGCPSPTVEAAGPLSEHEEDGNNRDLPENQRNHHHPGTGRAFCEVCERRTTKGRRHAHDHHLPWYAEPSQACWQCERRFSDHASLTAHLEEHPNGRFDSDRICLYVNSMLTLLGVLGVLAYRRRDVLEIAQRIERRLRQIIRFSTMRVCEWYASRQLLVCAGLGHLEGKPDGELVRYLLHWRVLCHLVARVPRAKLTTISEYPLTPVTAATQRRMEEDGIWLADAHFHWDRLQHLFPSSSLTEYLMTNRANACWRFTGLVANYVFPNSWPSRSEMRTIDDQPRLVATIGIHPKSAHCGWTREVAEEMRYLLHWRSVRAIGECGLDTSTPIARRSLDVQRDVFRGQLRLAAEFQLTVVIHSRGSEQEVLQMAQEELSPRHTIHVHCFTGSYSDVEAWVHAFEETSFGFTSLILDGRCDSTIRSLSLDRILLESDAPYLPPSGTNYPNHPWNVERVARYIGRIKNIPWTIIAESTSQNSKVVYDTRFSRQ